MTMAAALQQPALAPAGLPVPLARVLARLMEGVGPLPASRVPLEEAKGAVLAAPLVAPSPVPGAAIALRRGYAVASADTLGAGPYSPLPLPGIPALVEPGQALPPGKDALLPEDTVLIAGGLAEAQESAAPGQWTRRVGEDVPAGAVLRQAGEIVRDIDLALAEAAGILECEVRRPRVLWAGSASPAARLLRALSRSAGAAEAGSFTEADLVIATGKLPEILDGQGARLVADRLALRPGEDGSVLRSGDVPVLLVPDRPADALGMWLGLGLPLVRALAEASSSLKEERPVTRKIASTIGLSEVVLLRAVGRRFEPIGVGDLPLAAVAAADAWAIVPPESEGLAATESIEAELFAR